MTLHADLAALEASGLVRLSQIDPELEYLFRHALIQDAAYHSLLKTDRRRLHLMVGETLERLYPDRADTQELAPLLGQHFDEGGDDPRALKYFTLAGDAAARVYANSEAIALYTRALAIAERTTPLPNETLLHLYAQRGRAFELSNKYPEALQNYVDMEATAQARGDRPLELSALMLRATLHSTPTAVHDLAQGQQLCDRALGLARELNDRPAEAKILWNLLLLNTHKGSIREAIAYGERSLAIAREIGQREQIAFSLHDLANTYLFIGELPRAQAVLAESQQLWLELNNLPMLADSLCNNCGFYVLTGQYDQALALSEKAFNLSQTIDNLWDQSYSRFYVGYVYFDRGEMDAALRTMEQCRQLGEQAGFLVAMMQMRAEMALVYATLGDLQRAYELTDLIFTQLKELQKETHPYTWGLLAYLNVLDGNLERAEAILQRFPSETDAGELTSGGVLVPLAQTELALKQKNYPRVIEMTERFKVAMRRMGLHQYLPEVLYARSRAFLGQGDSEAAQRELEEARRAAEALNARRTLWQILAALGRIEAERGHPADARKFYQSAQEIIEYIANHIGDSELRQTFLSQPEVCQVRDEA
jgi:tetratricopeptide (TPR) repeat protein